MYSGNAEALIPETRLAKGERSVWQRRYWEHLIKDHKDIDRHIEYIHYNPVKHGYVKSPVDWPYSSFHQYVLNRIYSLDWGKEWRSDDLHLDGLE